MLKNHSNIVIKIIIIVGMLVATISLYLLLSIETPSKPLAGEGGTGDANIEIGGDFELINQDGNVFNSNSLKGRLSLIYFGFTYCPDICPTSLQKIMEVIDALEKYKIDIKFVFITIDPHRDTCNILKNYLQNFNEKFIGLTGSDDQIKKVANQFKVYYAKVGDDENYMIDHSSFIYLMDRQGKYIKHFYLNSSSQEIVDFVRVEEQNKK